MSAPRVQPARRIAYRVLRAVEQDDAYANLLLPALLAEARLAPADAALATELTYGTLRRRGFYDRVISLVVDRPLARMDPEVLDALRLGVHQLLETRVAPHAAVGESVALVASAGKGSARGFANGVLRTIARSTPEQWRARALEGLEGDARRAMETAHPEWVVAAFRDALSAEGNRDLDALLAADNLPPAVSLVALPGLAEAAEVGEPGGVSPLAARSAGGDPAENPVVASGRARVQDEGSQLAALALSRARAVLPGERWLDMCAGPGGKAALLAAEAAGGGASLIANELIPARAGLVRSALAVFDPAPPVLEGDATRFAGEPASFDRILLDAPCTGLGALRRRPEARWRKTPDDLPGLTRVQAALLDAAIAALKPGGILAYVTCSPHPAETRQIVAAARERHPEVEPVDTPAVLAAVATRDLELPPESHAQLWPHRHGTDAMFIQLLAKVAT
ncbi:MAG TPA: RsmB/NOP family class I SAM-dependent RNA methyltransferase [Pseudolysinimonas sp.]|nr:RsmB/NOP family class I SAM-dependent RNA methyltransferase [Pseudolysinimonas sp.]